MLEPRDRDVSVTNETEGNEPRAISIAALHIHTISACAGSH